MDGEMKLIHPKTFPPLCTLDFETFSQLYY